MQDQIQAGDDKIHGGAGNEVFIIGDAIDGDDDFDSIKLGKDQLFGEVGPGNEILNGDFVTNVEAISAGDDILNGGEGPDDQFCGQGIDTVDGGTGVDTASADCENVTNVP